MKDWKNITLKLPDLDLNKASDAISCLNILSVTIKDKRNKKDSDWFDDVDQPASIRSETHQVIVLVESSRNTKTLISQISLILGLNKMPMYSEEIFDDQDWGAFTQEQFKEIKISDTLRILPPWEPITEFRGKTLIIEPGTGFGTGSHPTTKLCLRWLEDNLKNNESLLDFGSGSGVLSIAAKIFGSYHVEGVEIDSMAIDNAKHNTTLNNCKIVFHEPTSFHPNKRYDVIVANILLVTLIKLSQTFQRLTKSKIILTGILNSQTELVINAYKPWIDLIEIESSEEWVLLYGEL